MLTFYFIRHAESVSNAGGITLEHAAIPLTAKGQQQALSLARSWSIPPAQIVVSELLRTQQTAQPLCDKYALPYQYQVNPWLNELHILSHELISDMTGAQRRPLAQAYWAQGDVKLRFGQQADTFDEFRQRVDGFISGLQHVLPHTVIIGHGIWFGMLMWRLMGFSAHDREGMQAFRAFQRHLPLANVICYALYSQDGQHWCIRHQPNL